MQTAVLGKNITDKNPTPDDSLQCENWHGEYKGYLKEV